MSVKARVALSLIMAGAVAYLGGCGEPKAAVGQQNPQEQSQAATAQVAAEETSPTGAGPSSRSGPARPCGMLPPSLFRVGAGADV